MRARGAAVVALVALVGCKADPDATADSKADPEAIADSRAAPAGRKAAAAELAPSKHGLVTDDMVRYVIANPGPVHYYGIYLNNQKFGWARVAWSKTSAGEPGGFRTDMSASMTVRVSGGESARETLFSSAVFYETESPFGLVEVRDTENGHEVVISKPDTEDTLASSVVGFRVDPAWLRVGQKQSFPVFDSDTRRDKTDTYRVVEITEQRVSGVPTQIAVIEETTEGETPTMTRVASGGVVLEAKVGTMTLKLEDKNLAQSNVIAFDAADGARIDRDLGDPKTVRELSVIARFAGGFAPPNTPYQRATRRADGSYELKLASGKPGNPVTPPDRRDGLAVTTAIDHDDPDIVALAATIARGASGDRERVERLNTWVYDNLEKSLSTHLSQASLVEQERVGDCTEHAALMIALARSLGIPAREISGLVYLGGAANSFGYHAWVEIALDGTWIPMDPSWGETQPNATHIVLGHGDNSDWATTMGAIELELN